MGESNDTLAISDCWKAQGYDTVVPVKTTDHPFMFKGDVDISPDHRLSVRYDRTVSTSFNESQFNCENFTSYDGQLESPGFGPPTAAGDMRRHQLGLRVDF